MLCDGGGGEEEGLNHRGVAVKKRAFFKDIYTCVILSFSVCNYYLSPYRIHMTDAKIAHFAQKSCAFFILKAQNCTWQSISTVTIRQTEAKDGEMHIWLSK